eukprot:13762227-Alexandrium_andersonii.AAC.1
MCIRDRVAPLRGASEGVGRAAREPAMHQALHNDSCQGLRVPPGPVHPHRLPQLRSPKTERPGEGPGPQGRHAD